MQETLNINYHKKTLLLQAITKCGVADIIISTLGISNKSDLQSIIISNDDSDIFNLEYHRKKLLVEALNNTNSKAEAAIELGISERTVHRFINIYNVCRSGEDEKGKYFIADTAHVKKVQQQRKKAHL